VKHPDISACRQTAVYEQGFRGHREAIMTAFPKASGIYQSPRGIAPKKNDTPGNIPDRFNNGFKKQERVQNPDGVDDRAG
jgi:hypothetical protein